MIKVFEIILCMSLKTISPDVPRCGRSLHVYVLFITDQYQKNYWAGLLVGKCCHCRINLNIDPVLVSVAYRYAIRIHPVLVSVSYKYATRKNLKIDPVLVSV